MTNKYNIYIYYINICVCVNTVTNTFKCKSKCKYIGKYFKYFLLFYRYSSIGKIKASHVSRLVFCLYNDRQTIAREYCYC